MYCTYISSANLLIPIWLIIDNCFIGLDFHKKKDYPWTWNRQTNTCKLNFLFGVMKLVDWARGQPPFPSSRVFDKQKNGISKSAEPIIKTDFADKEYASKIVLILISSVLPALNHFLLK